MLRPAIFGETISQDLPRSVERITLTLVFDWIAELKIAPEFDMPIVGSPDCTPIRLIFATGALRATVALWMRCPPALWAMARPPERFERSLEAAIAPGGATDVSAKPRTPNVATRIVALALLPGFDLDITVRIPSELVRYVRWSFWVIGSAGYLRVLLLRLTLALLAEARPPRQVADNAV